MPFDYSKDWSSIDCRKNPEEYQMGRGEQGVLLIQPYKSEILPHWRFRTLELARESAREILVLYRNYRAQADFPGMDMCRKFLQMGYTRSRRYANHRSGRKWSERTKPDGRGWSEGAGKILSYESNRFVSEKAQSAQIFRRCWRAVTRDPLYQQLKKEHLSGLSAKAPR